MRRAWQGAGPAACRRLPPPRRARLPRPAWSTAGLRPFPGQGHGPSQQAGARIGWAGARFRPMRLAVPACATLTGFERVLSRCAMRVLPVAASRRRSCDSLPVTRAAPSPLRLPLCQRVAVGRTPPLAARFHAPGRARTLSSWAGVYGCRLPPQRSGGRVPGRDSNAALGGPRALAQAWLCCPTPHRGHGPICASPHPTTSPQTRIRAASAFADASGGGGLLPRFARRPLRSCHCPYTAGPPGRLRPPRPCSAS